VRDLIDEAYGSGNPRMRVSAIHAMGRNCDTEWLPTLIDNLTDDDAEVRYEAALACGAIGEDEAAPHLADLIEDEDTEVRLAAIEALGAIGALGGSETARETLESHLNDEDEVVREAVRAALDEVREIDDPFGFMGATRQREARNGHK
jgi:HEAT repeat protein